MYYPFTLILLSLSLHDNRVKIIFLILQIGKLGFGRIK